MKFVEMPRLILIDGENVFLHVCLVAILVDQNILWRKHIFLVSVKSENTPSIIFLENLD